MPNEILLDPCPGPDCLRGLVAHSVPMASPTTLADPAPDSASMFKHWIGEQLSWPEIIVILQNETSASTGETFLWRAVVSNGRSCLLICPHRLFLFYRQHHDRLFEIHDGQQDRALLDRLFTVCGRSAQA